MDNSPINTLSICTGIAGLELGLALALPSVRTVCYVERDAFAVSGLIERMEAGRLDRAPVWTDVKTFDCEPWRGHVDIITGGYPCQPFSIIGNRSGKDHPSHLWPHISKMVSGLRPGIVFFENVEGHISLGLSEVLNDLSNLGYYCASSLFSAEECNLPQERERVYIVGLASESVVDYSGGSALYVPSNRRALAKKAAAETRGLNIVPGDVPALTFPPSPASPSWDRIIDECPAAAPVCELNFRGLADGAPLGRDTLRGLGNSVIPVQAGLAFATLLHSIIDHLEDFDAGRTARDSLKISNQRLEVTRHGKGKRGLRR